MQFSFGKKDPVSSSKSSATDEKLQRAIDRNKKKMAQRQARMSQKSSAAPANSMASRLRQNASSPEQVRKSSSSSSLLQKMRANKSMNASATKPSSSSIQGPSASLAQKLRGSSTPPELTSRELPKRTMTSSASHAGPARKPIRSNDSIEIQAPVRRSESSPASVNYETKRIASSRSTKKRKKKTFELASWFVKGAWIFCGFLILRLIFSEGGILEFQQTRSSYQNMQKELKELKVENENLMVELDQMKDDSIFQKKLVRDHLGYIDKNEYLILFSTEN